MGKPGLSRREFLKLVGALAASAAVTSCGPVYAQLAQEQAPFASLAKLEGGGSGTSIPYVFAALNRLTFGARPDERESASQIGLAGWIEEQLAPEGIEDRRCELRLRAFDTLRLSASDLADLSDKLFDNVDRQSVPDELRQATLVRQVYSRRQLFEGLVEFWSDHFNISVEKGECYFLKTVDDRQVVRAHALGKFSDLLWASAHSPSMLVYLDNQSNHKGTPNENYARELMELHTLGVNGGYTQNDVMELARCLTGWTVKEHFWRGEFTFKPELHDSGPKTVLGLSIAPGGQAEAESVLAKLAVHPNTAYFLANKLARRFIADEPPGELVKKAAQAFQKTDGDIRSVLRVLLLDGLASQPALAQAKFKRPARFVVSILRMLDAQTDGGPALQDYLLRLGQPYFAWPTPDGYPDRANAWMGNLMPRWQLAYALAHNELKGTKVDLAELGRASQTASQPALLDTLSTLLLGAPLSPDRQAALLNSLGNTGMTDSDAPATLTAALLASPDFQWY